MAKKNSTNLLTNINKLLLDYCDTPEQSQKKLPRDDVSSATGVSEASVLLALLLYDDEIRKIDERRELRESRRGGIDEDMPQRWSEAFVFGLLFED